MATNFFVMTRGRTGSTALVDELNQASTLCVTKELFLSYNFGNNPELLESYKLILPFDLWKRKGWWWTRAAAFFCGDVLQAQRYLKSAEELGRRQGKAGFGFKILSHFFDQRPYLRNLLKRRGYRTIYLTRNRAHQVLSGMVAKQRGKYNTTGHFKDFRRYHINLDEFQQLVEWENLMVEKDQSWLRTEGFNFIVVSYERFCSDRQAFYDEIFQFLGLPPELPPTSDYSIMIKDLRYTIENYDAVVERAAAMGLSLTSLRPAS